MQNRPEIYVRKICEEEEDRKVLDCVAVCAIESMEGGSRSEEEEGGGRGGLPSLDETPSCPGLVWSRRVMAAFCHPRFVNLLLTRNMKARHKHTIVQVEI